MNATQPRYTLYSKHVKKTNERLEIATLGPNVNHISNAPSYLILYLMD